MSKLKVGLFSLFLAGCVSVSKEDYCKVPPDRLQEVIEKVEALIKENTDEHVTYEAPEMFLQEGKLINGEKGCYVYLMPKSLRKGWHVLDGDGGIYVNPQTLEVGPVFWYRY